MHACTCKKKKIKGETQYSKKPKAHKHYDDNTKSEKKSETSLPTTRSNQSNRMHNYCFFIKGVYNYFPLGYSQPPGLPVCSLLGHAIISYH